MSDSIYKTNYLITGIEDTPALREYADKKIRMLEKYLKHYTDETNEMIFDVEIGKTTDHHRKGGVFRAEINFSAGPVRMRSVAIEENLYAAIDEAKDDLKRELRKHKSKHLDHVRRGAAKLKGFLRGWKRQ